MKPQNNEFLNNLLSKYSEFEGILHGGKENESTKKKIKAQPEEHGAAPEMIAYGVQQKALNILAEISSIVSDRSEGKKHQGKEGEERMSRVISKFLKRYPEAQDVYREELGLRGKIKIAKTVPTMNDLLDEIGVSVGEILSQSQSFIPDIYRTSANGRGDDGIVTGSGNGMEEVRSAPKYEILMQVLSSLGVDPRNVSVTTETMDPKRMRKYPYKIVHIVGVPHPITLTVSDEIGQSTYIYPRYVDLSQFIEAKKGSTLSGICPEEIIYGEKYRERMTEVIGRMLLGEVKKGNSEEINEGHLTGIGNYLLIQNNLTPEILRYQAMLLGAREELKEVGILERELDGDMVWFFDEAKGTRNWPEIGGRNLKSFPKGAFNKEKGIGNQDGTILALQQLAKMFEALGLRVATEEEYILLQEERYKQQIPLWREELLSHREALEKVGIVEKQIGDEMVWCFNETKGAHEWPKIGEKGLISFPNSTFNKTKEIRKKDGSIENSQQLAKMFEALGLRIATEEEYMFLQNEKYGKQIPFWRKELLSEREALEKVGIVEKQIGDEMVWCFNETKGNHEWPKIGEKSLRSFPSCTFNKDKEIENEEGMIANPQQLAKMFATLGLRVATEEEYIALWREELLSHREALEKVGIVEKQIGDEMVWFFDEAKGTRNWPEIGGRNLKSFPKGAFNKEKGIGNQDGTILALQQLAKMFEALGLRVATEEEYILLQEERYKQQIPLWREELLSHREALEKVGIVEKQIGDEMVWCFNETKGNHEWPKIGEKSLRSFPSRTFNKDKEIENDEGMITNPQQLAKMFATLGLRVATEEEYIALWRKELLSEREALEKVGVMEIEIHGEMIWCFDEAKGMKQWPKIGERGLTTFPNGVFNKDKGIGSPTRGKINNPQELAKLFEALGLRVKHPEKKKKTD